ncbi:High-affinity nitrate transporter 2.2 [Phytophthora nicotianae]|uniref:High-affinity nitrate transporter 2.2 n=1 Tax=Phytophthora nicotianae TaxID=4792 RepID=A0A0W8DE25_PHYNI|nr:High-affinity nitrate transporter 2.2 [Phytophthora nicotianae]
MAKRKFVSSKKNAPSRAISSKEAALHRRTADGDGAESDSGDSAASSDVGSSTPLSSEDEQEEDDDELNASQDVTPMAVEVMPASVGRGKQLRFPTAISRGKVLPMEGGAASDADDSDDESLLSVADSEDEDGVTAMEVDEPAVSTSPVHIEASPATQDLKINSKDTPFYPIKAAVHGNDIARTRIITSKCPRMFETVCSAYGTQVAAIHPPTRLKVNHPQDMRNSDGDLLQEM